MIQCYLLNHHKSVCGLKATAPRPHKRHRRSRRGTPPVLQRKAGARAASSRNLKTQNGFGVGTVIDPRWWKLL